MSDLGTGTLKTLLTEERLRIYPRLILGAAACAFVFAVASSSGVWTVSGTIGGDYPAFYTGGRIVWDGQQELLYDWPTQAKYQTDLHPDERGGFLPYVYPPFVALAYAPLAAFPFIPSYVLHTIIEVLALGMAVYWMRPMLPKLRGRELAAFAIALSFYPMGHGVVGSQNTAYTLLLLVAIWRGLHTNRDAWTGLALGLLFYKPHFAVPIFGLLLLAKETRALIIATLTVSVLYVVAALVSGWNWPVKWWQLLPKFQAMDNSVNRGNSVGSLGFFETLLGPGESIALVIGIALTLIWIGVLMWVWWKQRGDLADRMGLAATGLVLIPPHLMFYDAGLLILPLAVLAQKQGERWFLPLLAIWLLSYVGALSFLIGVNMLFVLAVIVGAMVWIQRTLPGEGSAMHDAATEPHGNIERGAI